MVITKFVSERKKKNKEINDRNKIFENWEKELEFESLKMLPQGEIEMIAMFLIITENMNKTMQREK